MIPDPFVQQRFREAITILYKNDVDYYLFPQTTGWLNRHSVSLRMGDPFITFH